MTAGETDRSDGAVTPDGDVDGAVTRGRTDGGLVATADHLASTAGRGLLRAGGTAADAAVAAAAVLAVTGPHRGDLGGDLYAVVHEPGGTVTALCGAGRAGSGADALQMRCEDLRRVPPRGDVRAVTVPGCVDGWLELHGRYGALPLAQVLEPAITYAAAGFPASPDLAALSEQVLDLPGAGDLTAPALANRGRLEPGTVVRRPGVAAALGAVASAGRAGLYLGPFGDGLIELGAGLFSRADLARNQAEWVEPLRLEVWDHVVWAPPPPSQGYLTLAGAAVAERLGVPTDPGDPAWAHLLVETARAVGGDRPQVLHDGADGAALLDPGRLARQAATVDPERATVPAGTAAPGSTTALSAVDGDRMAVSLVQSNADRFGAHIVEPATGVFLHNRGIGFSLEAGHPGELQPGRRPPHTLSPTVVTGPGGALRASLGTRGGDAQPQVLLQLLARLLLAGATAPEAVEAGRWVLGGGGFSTWDHGAGDRDGDGRDRAGRDGPGRGPASVSLEAEAPAAWEAELAARGHRVVRQERHPDPAFGHAQVIQATGGGLEGAADPRAGRGGVAGI